VSITPVFDEFIRSYLPAEEPSLEELEQRAAVLAAAQSLVGKARWIHMGREAGGVDCGGVMVFAFRTAGLIPSDFVTPHYSADFMKHRDEPRFVRFVETFSRRVWRTPRPADVVLCQYARSLSHCAMVKEWPTVIHAIKSAGTVVEDDCGKGELRLRFRGVWSFQGWT
jgi:cell wall-associated NlpC family hydrolase